MGFDGVEWRKSSFSGTDNCVEVGFAVDRVLVRDSKDETAAALRFDSRRWREFTTALVTGELGSPSR